MTLCTDNNPKNGVRRVRPLGTAACHARHARVFLECCLYAGEREDAMPTKCQSCGNPMTWAAQRRQYGCLIKLWRTPQQAQELMPRCQKCVTTQSNRADRTSAFRTKGGQTK
jgi:hypothetical protein